MSKIETVVDRLRVGTTPAHWKQTFEVTCESGHKHVYSVDDMENAWWTLGDVECETCGEGGVEVSPEQVQVECQACRESMSVDFEEVPIAGQTCLGGISCSLKPVGGSSYFRSLLKDFYELAEQDAGIHRQRLDLWNVVIHFTDIQSLVSILRDRVVRARPTGFFSHRSQPKHVRQASKAVCLTETPLELATDVINKHGPVGLAFRKPDLGPLRLAPAIEIPKSVLRQQQRYWKKHLSKVEGCIYYGLHGSMLPYINKYDSDGFPHRLEREWRVPCDIEIGCYRPMLILPDSQLDVLMAHESRVPLAEIGEWLAEFGRMKAVEILTFDERLARIRSRNSDSV